MDLFGTLYGTGVLRATASMDTVAWWVPGVMGGGGNGGGNGYRVQVQVRV